MAQMFRILVRCPATHEVIDTGIRTSGRDALSSGLYREATAWCPRCRQFHPFEGNAFVEPAVSAQSNGLWRPNP